jgi:hypothetical protein
MAELRIQKSKLKNFTLNFINMCKAHPDDFDFQHYLDKERKDLIEFNIIPENVYDIISKLHLKVLTESTCRRFGKSSYEISLMLYRILHLPFYNHGFALKHKSRLKVSGKTVFESVIDRFVSNGFIPLIDGIYLKDKCLGND